MVAKFYEGASDAVQIYTYLNKVRVTLCNPRRTDINHNLCDIYGQGSLKLKLMIKFYRFALVGPTIGSFKWTKHTIPPKLHMSTTCWSDLSLPDHWIDCGVINGEYDSDWDQI